MQPVLHGPRQALDANAVRRLLQGSTAVKVEYGAEWLGNNLALVSDVSGYMSKGSTVASDCFATIHRTCSLKFDSNVPFNYVTDFVKPYMVLTDLNSGFKARFNLGVYTLQTPVFDNGTLPSVLTFTGYDLIYFLDQPIGSTFTVPQGQDPAAVAAALIAQAVPYAVVNYEESTELTPFDATWPFDDQNQFTYLEVINTLLKMAGYAPVWVDWEGAFQVHAFADPLTAQTEWDFNLLDSTNIVAVPRASIQDFFSVPNYWRFVRNNLTSAPVEGVSMLTYVDNQIQNPGSFPNRGRYIKKIQSVDATSFQALWVQAVQQIGTDLLPSEIFDVQTSPFPLAWHKDIFSYFDPNIAAIQPAKSSLRRVQAVTWQMSLDGADTTWTWQTINTTLSLQDAGNYPAPSLELVPNWSFESGSPPTGWYPNASSNIYTSLGPSVSGLFSAKIVAKVNITAGLASSGIGTTKTSDPYRGVIKVVPNQAYTLKAMMMPADSSSPTRTYGVYVDWWTGSGKTGVTYISTSGDDYNVGSVSSDPNGWSTLEKSITAPATAYACEVYAVVVRNGVDIPVGEAHYVDNVSLIATG